MGYYLVFNGKENNTKSISYPMGAIIRDVLPKDMEEDEYGWIWMDAKKETRCCFIEIHNVSIRR